MKYVVLAVVLLLPACDKAMHFGAGYGISVVVADVTGSKPLGCVAAIVAGAAKEAIDIIPDPIDFVATAAGGCTVPHPSELTESKDLEVLP